MTSNQSEYMYEFNLLTPHEKEVALAYIKGMNAGKRKRCCLKNIPPDRRTKIGIPGRRKKGQSVQDCPFFMFTRQ